MADTPELIFHYTNPDSAKSILRSMHLRMSTYRHLNDPRESKTWPFKFFARSPQTFDENLFDQAADLILDRTNVLCFVTGDPHEPADGNGDGTRIIGSGFARPRMWAQYGNSHSGFCLAFDKAVFEEVARRQLGEEAVTGRVEYVDHAAGLIGESGDPYSVHDLETVRADGIETVIEDHIRRFHRELFFTKHVDWRDESEYRLIVRSRDTVRVEVPIHTSLSEVVAGSECSEEDIREIAMTCASNDIPLFRIHWHGWEASRSQNLLDGFAGNQMILDGLIVPETPGLPFSYARVPTDSGEGVTLEIRLGDDRPLECRLLDGRMVFRLPPA